MPTNRTAAAPLAVYAVGPGGRLVPCRVERDAWGEYVRCITGSVGTPVPVVIRYRGHGWADDDARAAGLATRLRGCGYRDVRVERMQ